MTADQYLELAPLSALGALDGADRAAFHAHVAGCANCGTELRAHQRVAETLGLAAGEATPGLRLRRRVLGAVDPDLVAPLARPGGSSSWMPAVAAAAVAAVALGLFVRAGRERDAAQSELAQVREDSARNREEARRGRDELSLLRAQLSRQQPLRALLAHPDSRVASLSGLPAAPQARGRVVWNPVTRGAVLVAAGLAPAPPGKAYEMWVIAKGAPVPAGVFQTEPDGTAVFALPNTAETADARTFAVTLEPEAGTDTPTGPMVLAGATS